MTGGASFVVDTEPGPEHALRTDLTPRYAPGEDVEPLVRALGGGALGVLMALALDGLVVSAPDVRWALPALLAQAVGGDRTATALGTAVVVVLGLCGGLLFAYGQVRRFLPGRSWVAGAAWGAGAWLLAAGALLPSTVDWHAIGGVPEPARVLAMASLVTVETLAAGLAYGTIVGVLNPRGER
jgi:hypothetical protein